MSQERFRPQPVRRPTVRRETAPAKKTDTRLAAFLRGRMDDLKGRGISQADVAHRLGVSEATVSRVIHGRAVRLKEVTEEAFCQALELDEAARDQLHHRAASAGMRFAEYVPQERATNPRPPTVVRYRALDLDILESTIAGWSEALERHKEPSKVLLHVQRVHQRLRALTQSGRRADVSLAQDIAYTGLRIRTTMLYAGLQEAVLPWRSERPRAAIATYQSLMDDVFLTVPDRQLPKGYEKDQARLLLRQALLERERERDDICEQGLHVVGAYDLEMTEDPVLQVAYETQRLHTSAIRGTPADIPAWEHRAAVVQRRINQLASSLPAEQVQNLQDVLDYAIGVGWKRFMWHLLQEQSQTRRGPQARVSSPRIAEYARRASNVLDGLRSRMQAGLSVHNINMYHPSIPVQAAAMELEASVIDALVWYEPEEAVHRSLALRSVAEERYPSVLPKLDDAIRRGRR